MVYVKLTITHGELPDKQNENEAYT